MEKQTAGRDALNDFAPKFAELNDDVLFGEVWSREAYLSLKIRSIVTVTSLISKGIVDNSLSYHLSAARKNGVTKTEMAEILTHAAFYAGWPNAWAAFRLAKEVYADDAKNRTTCSRTRWIFWNRSAKCRLCKVFYRKQLSESTDRSKGDSIYCKCYLRTGMPE